MGKLSDPLTGKCHHASCKNHGQYGPYTDSDDVPRKAQADDDR